MKYLNTFKTFEGLIKSVPIDKAVEILKKNLPNLDYIEGDSTTIRVIFTEPVLLGQIKPLINNLGYFIYNINDEWSMTDIEDRGYFSADDTEVMSVDLEAKFYNNQITEKKILYHVTTTKSVEKILRQGLVPKSKSKKDYHPERIYLTDSFWWAKNIPLAFEKFGYNGPWCILKIDTTDLNISLYEDPQMPEDGFYTTSNIPPKNISIVKGFHNFEAGYFESTHIKVIK
jgi:hypothetical protein